MNLTRSRATPPRDVLSLARDRRYYARHVMVRSLLVHFLRATEAAGGATGISPQVVVLGCGFDTLHFQLRKNGELDDDVRYVECDFPDVVAKKRSIMESIDLKTADRYSLVGVDVRDVDGLMAKLDQAGVRYVLNGWNH